MWSIAIQISRHFKCHILFHPIKRCIQQYRYDKWDILLNNVKSFCNKRNINIQDMNVRYVKRRGRAHHQQADFTIEHYYHVALNMYQT